MIEMGKAFKSKEKKRKERHGAVWLLNSQTPKNFSYSNISLKKQSKTDISKRFLPPLQGWPLLSLEDNS